MLERQAEYTDVSLGQKCMKYILDERFRFRGWYKKPTGIYDTRRKEAFFPDADSYLTLLKCDGANDVDLSSLDEKAKNTLKAFEEEGIIRRARFGEFLQEDQMYRAYPARYRKSVHWSITGACNLKCRHCFMSAPNAKHGAPSHEEIIRIADQMAECGIFQVGITGGEPLIRDDLMQIIDALNEREIGITVIYTNGWLVDEVLLDALEERNVHPGFQLSYDGVGWHDWLRGVSGAEERTIKALKLLQERNFRTSVSMCIHRKNQHTLRESVKLMAELGVTGMKVNAVMELGEWANPELADARISAAEEMEIYEAYIPQYFEDNAPLPISLGDFFEYTPGESEWKIGCEKPLTEEEVERCPSCGVLTKHFYIGADGMVAPCMGMADSEFSKQFPNLRETPLKEILRDSGFVDLCNTTVGEVRRHNPECLECPHIDRCTGGCRQVALVQENDFYAIDRPQCEFFKNRWDERIRRAADPAFAEYIKRNNA